MKEITIGGFFIDNECIRFVDNAKNLGVWIDCNLSFSAHINKTVCSCFLTLKELSKIKQFLPSEYINTIVTTLILLKLDYCNSLFYKINSDALQKLQSVQNIALRMVFNRTKFDSRSIEPLFHEIHWLRIPERIVFKLCLITHKCIWATAPDALRDLLTVSNDRTYKLMVPKCNSAFGERMFARSAPKIWNNLPIELRTEGDPDKFKKDPKSFLMTTNLNNFYSLLNM